MPGLLSQLITVLRKDFLLEWRTRSRMGAVLFFGAMTLLLFSFAGGADSDSLRHNAPGYLWLALLLASTLSLGESFRVEAEDNALEGLRLIPLDPRALFLGKAIANAILLLLLGLVFLPLSMGLYGVHQLIEPGSLLAILALGTAGLAGPGTVYAAMTSRARGRDVMLPLLLFPLVVPVLLATVKATSLCFDGDAMRQLPSWTTLLAVFDIIYWSLGALLFERVIED